MHWRGAWGEPRVIRVMPNLPALVGQGISVYCGGLHAEALDFQRAEEVLNAVGVCIQGPEELMDPVTALSGTGPAYVFHTMEAMIESEWDGHSRGNGCRILVRQTVLAQPCLLRNLTLTRPPLERGGYLQRWYNRCRNQSSGEPRIH